MTIPKEYFNDLKINYQSMEMVRKVPSALTFYSLFHCLEIENNGC